MKKINHERKSVIDPAHPPGIGSTHDREQLRKRLLQMILKSESERRSMHTPGGRAAKQNHSAQAKVELSVFDPEDLLSRELLADSSPQKRA
jgi:hypothetical protein